eukprot:jgi/Mesvir1/13915/Mv16036-RA.1
MSQPEENVQHLTRLRVKAVDSFQVPANRLCEDFVLNSQNAEGSEGLFCVFDGHNGHEVAKMLEEHLETTFYACLNNKSPDVPGRTPKRRKSAPGGADPVRETGSPFDGTGRISSPTDALCSALASVETRLCTMINDAEEDRRYDLSVQGSCAIASYFRAADGDSTAPQFFCASIGDCRAVLGIEHDGVMHAVPLYGELDNASNPVETARLARAGQLKEDRGPTFYAAHGHLQLTKAVGSLYLKDKELWKLAASRASSTRAFPVWKGPLIGSEPSVDTDRGDNVHFLIVGSDGLFDLISEDCCVHLVDSYLKQGEGKPAARLADVCLRRAAFQAGMDVEELVRIPCVDGKRRALHDDITITVVSFGCEEFNIDG